MHLKAAISRNPYLYYRAALLYKGRREMDNAIYQVEKALSLSPNDKLYLKELDELKKLKVERGGYADELNK